MIEAVPLLQRQRDLYRIPPGMERFEAYRDLLANGHPERLPTLPLEAMNPMAKEHVAERLDELLDAGAERWLQDFTTEANQRLKPALPLKMCWVLVDDLKGGWTSRHLTEAASRFEKARYHQEWIPVLLWVTEEVRREHLRVAALGDAYRHFHKVQHGAPKTLEQMLTQEGRALNFAGAPLTLSLEELEYTREVLREHLQTAHFPTVFACLYGDQAAAKVGYPPLGLSDRAGFEFALACERGILSP